MNLATLWVDQSVTLLGFENGITSSIDRDQAVDDMVWLSMIRISFFCRMRRMMTCICFPLRILKRSLVHGKAKAPRLLT